jgi:hypothetical protein
MATIVQSDREQVLARYAAESRAFSDAVEHLRKVHGDTEAFIKALVTVGAAHRACEHSRIALDKQLRNATTAERP